MKNMQMRLTALFFLEFAVWGSYLTSMSGYLWSIGLQGDIGWFYSVQGFVSIFMPTLMGIVADRKIEAQKLLGLCHLLSAVLMGYVGYVGLTTDNVAFADLFPAYAVAVAFYMPTLGLSNSAAYTAMSSVGMDKVAKFPRIRIFGTVGFIVSMLLVDLLGIQHNAYQFIVCAIWGLALGAYSFSLPRCATSQQKTGTWVESMGLDAFALFKEPRMLIFFIFSLMLGVSLQITNGFANPYISAFGTVEEYKGVYFVEHANLLISLSQVSETLCILLIPFFMKRYGIKAVMLIAMTAWALRFGMFGIGSPTWPGVLCLVVSMIVYGVAFDFFNISGSLFVDNEVSPEKRSSAQGLFLLMTNGLGASIGTLGAQAVLDHLMDGASTPAEQIDCWRTAWLIFAAYAALVGVAFALVFRGAEKKPGENKTSMD